MGSSNYLPTKEANLVNWSANFDAKITASPIAYGLSAPQAAAYTVLHAAFVSAYRACQENDTRTPSAIVTKNDAKEALVSGVGGIRELVRIVQGFPGTTNTERSDLGISLRNDEPTPVPVPAVAPTIEVAATFGRTIKVRLHDSSTPTRRSKPEGVQGATVFSFVGENAPDDIGQWQFEGNTTRGTCDVEFPATIATGSKVWLTATWYNPRGQSGPPATPIASYLQFGGLSMAA